MHSFILSFTHFCNVIDKAKDFLSWKVGKLESWKDAFSRQKG
jgi:hypothetical protein